MRTIALILSTLTVFAACERHPPNLAATGSASGSASKSGSAKPKQSADPSAPKDVADPPPADAETTQFKHFASKIMRPGTGTVKPAEGDLVDYQWDAWTTEGVRRSPPNKRKQSTKIEGGQPRQIWPELAMLMTEGEVRRFWIPEKPNAPESGKVVVDFELVAIHHAIPAPDDVAAAPKDASIKAITPICKGEAMKPGATCDVEGKKVSYDDMAAKFKLASKVEQKGTGTDHPVTASKVKVNYTGWTTDGKMFDSSLQRGEPTEFPLTGVIKGWTEGIPLMVVGEKRRFWIPEDLAYKGQPSKPQGTLVFDVELLSFETPPPAPSASASKK
jgi:peptidylprolyl isomerase